MRTVVVTDPPRADTNDAAALGSSGVATVHEAQGRTGYLGPEFRPAWPGARIGGTAVTVLCWPGDNLMIHVAVEQCRPGDVLVVATNSPCSDGLFGELLATALAYRGVRGAVLGCGVSGGVAAGAGFAPLIGLGLKDGLLEVLELVADGDGSSVGGVMMASSAGICTIISSAMVP